MSGESGEIRYNVRKGGLVGKKTNTHLEPLILQDLLNRDVGSILRTTGELGLEYNAEGAVSDDLAVGVGDVSRFTGLSV